AETVAADVPVLALPRAGTASPGLTTGALVLVAVPPDAVPRVAQASVSAFLSVVLTR
ncbi:MAG: hypothetical protein HOQ45_23350, partial [Nocardioidaceae bacterium]|nr:hypothetical protein [Nocardioidaceae bacterium]